MYVWGAGPAMSSEEECKRYQRWVERPDVVGKAASEILLSLEHNSAV